VKKKEKIKQKKQEPQKYTFSAHAASLKVPLWKAMQIANYARTQMREELIEWLFKGCPPLD
jgi:hypothetical protein